MSNCISPGIKGFLLSDELQPKLDEIREEYLRKIEQAHSRSEKSKLKKQMKSKLVELTKQFMKENGNSDPYCLY